MTNNYTHWNEWDLPNDEQLKAFVKLVTPYIKWLSPDIVKSIADFNEQHRTVWSAQLNSVGVPMESYLWERSPCVFPGVRRHGSGDKPSAFKDAKRKPTGVSALEKDPHWTPSLPQHLREMYRQKASLATDDNSYPYELWRYVVRGVKSGPDPRNVGFHLAHLFPHNDYTLKQLRDSSEKSGDHWLGGWPEVLPEYSFSGLYTSAANLCFIPAELMRPTDLNGPLRRLMLQKAHSLYGDVCNMFPHGLQALLHKEDEKQWHHTEFSWDERFTGDIGRMDAFNSYRAGEFTNLIAQKQIVLAGESVSE
ncbi:hypothetical protein [Hymenobacter lapidiphilus]|uniref:hypothetical protein n=1 Tax=Hymenobacter sp. CCM 8763 TaxID=2303334 RepID=UPI0011C1C8EC|nr:hypothetical protein [Hymenobacter sp. CCM 8763]